MARKATSIHKRANQMNTSNATSGISQGTVNKTLQVKLVTLPIARIK
uniref:Uncharacterized protein n=1 Tax=Arundo donax TaxID=35708 RepID=A0A0A9E7U2_ARUDO